MQYPAPGMRLPGPDNEELVLEEALGTGAFGIVFKATGTTSGNMFAIKFPHFAPFVGQEEMTAFLNEVQAAQEIRHPNVVRVDYVGVDIADIPPFLVMEYLDGGNLALRLEQHRDSDQNINEDLFRSWTYALIEGISAVNEKMLHRDLKPDNILMEGDTLKIGDFGLSKLVDAVTRSRTFKGGQHMLYMAPEGWKLETNRIQIDMEVIEPFQKTKSAS